MKQHITIRRHSELVSESIMPSRPSFDAHAENKKQDQDALQRTQKKAALSCNKAAFCM
jgi:hypothetical protein